MLARRTTEPGAWLRCAAPCARSSRAHRRGVGDPPFATILHARASRSPDAANMTNNASRAAPPVAQDVTAAWLLPPGTTVIPTARIHRLPRPRASVPPRSPAQTAAGPDRRRPSRLACGGRPGDRGGALYRPPGPRFRIAVAPFVIEASRRPVETATGARRPFRRRLIAAPGAGLSWNGPGRQGGVGERMLSPARCDPGAPSVADARRCPCKVGDVARRPR